MSKDMQPTPLGWSDVDQDDQDYAIRTLLGEASRLSHDGPPVLSSARIAGLLAAVDVLQKHPGRKGRQDRLEAEG